MDLIPATTVNQRSRKLSLKHRTRFTYDQPVNKSAHAVHLRPIHDWRQKVHGHRLAVSPQVEPVEYEDVFGNFAKRFTILQPYTELVMEAESVIELLDVDPFAFASVPMRPQFPLVWMPWERTMLAPYLQPEELSDTQLQELFDFAMSFVNKNNNDLMETLFAINLGLFRELKYMPGSTNLYTTPYQVFTHKQGVCQDFANLFITLARLLGIPARYVCGYVYTGNDSPSRAIADQTHAWVQLFIPSIGWKGFDPTNGVLPHLDHVRLAYGRYWRDTAPTAATIYTPSYETMSIDVLLREISDDEAESITAAIADAQSHRPHVAPLPSDPLPVSTVLASPPPTTPDPNATPVQNLVNDVQAPMQNNPTAFVGANR